MDISDQTMFLSFFGIATYRFFVIFCHFSVIYIYIYCDFCFFWCPAFAAELDNVKNRAFPCVFCHLSIVL